MLSVISGVAHSENGLRQESLFTDYTQLKDSLQEQGRQLPATLLSEQRLKEAVSETESKVTEGIQAYGMGQPVNDISLLTGDRKSYVHVGRSSVYAAHSTLATNVTVAKTSANTVTLRGFLFGEDAMDIKATVDLATGQVTIKPQPVVTTDVGNALMCKMNLKNNTYDSKAEIKGHVYDNAIVIDDSFGFFITTGANAGAYLTVGFMEYAAIANSNGGIVARRVTFNGQQTTADRQVVQQETQLFAYPLPDNKLRLMNVPMLDKASDVNITLNLDGTMQIDPQPVGSNSYYGDLYLFKVTENTDASGNVKFSASVLNPITASYDAAAKGITIGGYGVATPTLSALFGTYEGSNVTLTNGIEFPTAPTLKLEGEGTAESPWIIKQASDLVAIAQDASVNKSIRSEVLTETGVSDPYSYQNIYSGKYFKLGADITFNSDTVMTPIGSKELRFNGVLIGDGHKIKDFTIQNYAYDHCGLFRTLGKDSKVSGIVFESPYISSIGYTVGVVAGTSYGDISDIRLDNPVLSCASGYNIGGIAGYSYGKLKNITVSNIQLTSQGYCGGAAGRSYTDLENINVTGRIVMGGKQAFGGGIVGHATKLTIESPQPQIRHCGFGGRVVTANNATAIGGIAGGFSYAKMESCFSAAQVVSGAVSDAYAGGLIGTAFESEIIDSYASGIVSNTTLPSVGGVIGQITKSVSGSQTPTIITNCYSSAMLVTGSTEPTRGIIGRAEGSVLANCFYDSQVAPLGNEVQNGRLTSDITSAKGPEGFSSDKWVFTEGLYPRIKGMENTDAAAVSAAALILDNNDVLDNVTKNFRYATHNGVKWQAAIDGNLNDTRGYAFGFSNGEGVLNNTQHTDTVFVSKGDVSKYYILNIAPVMFEGEGTAANPWKIKTTDDFKLLSKITVDATMNFVGKHFQLVNDLDFGGDTIVPICKTKKPAFNPDLMFEGEFDGCGHTIDNFVIKAVEFFTAQTATGTAVAGQVNPKSDNTYANAGVFAAIGATGVVKNLTVGTKARYHLFQRGGAIAGNVQGLVENCANYGEVLGYYSAIGGIAGYVNGGTIVKGYNGGRVAANANTTGGIAGDVAAEALIEQCENTGEVSAHWFNPYQKVDTQYGAGGIAGTVTGSKVINVVNSGKVWSGKQVGGIVSKVSGTAAKPCTVKNAVNYGLVYADKEKTSLGRIAGVNSLGTYENCYSDAQLQRNGDVANTKAEGVKALASTELSNGKVALPDSAFSLKAGAYPSLKYSTVPLQAALNAAAVVSIKAGEYAGAMMHEASLSEGVTWNLVKKEVFSINGGKLNVILPSAGCFNDTLVASGNGVERRIPVATLNPDLFEGDGTAQVPFVISSPEEFGILASFVNDYGFDYEGYWFTVTRDLDFKGISFKGVDEFGGVFDGNGKEFSNVDYVSSTTDKTATGRGLFNTVTSAGLIKNVVLGGTSSIGSYTISGGIAGNLYGAVSGCVNKGTVSSVTTYAGGIAGMAYPSSKIESCVNEGTVTAKTNYAGGILGATGVSAAISVDSCRNSGKVTGAKNVGGIIGSASAYVVAVTNSGVVTSTGTYAGGIMGEALLPSSIKDAENTGTVSANQYVGGIVSLAAAHTDETPFVLENCRNNADLVPGTATTVKGWVGGIACTTKAGTRASNCVNTGKIEGQASIKNHIRLAGLFADFGSSSVAKSTITDCHNEGAVTAFSNSGGVIGYVSGDSARIVRCYNVADITGGGTSASAAANIGGIVGNGNCHITDCWNAGNISAGSSYVGGIHGQCTSSDKYDLFRNANFGDVSSSIGTKVGGIVGMGRSRMVACYNFGTVSAPDIAGGLLGQPGNVAAASYIVRVHDSYNAGKIVCKGTNQGNIAGYNASCKYIDFGGCYYDNTVNGALKHDATYADGVKGVTTAELVDADISNAFDKGVATYPSLKNLSDNDYNSFYTATVLFAAEESAQSIRSAFLIGTPAGAEWSGTPNLEIAGNTVTPKAVQPGEKATLTLKVGKLSRTYDLTIAVPSGIDNIGSGKEILRTEYYLANGERISSIEGVKQVVVRRTVYVDGTTSVTKFVPAVR